MSQPYERYILFSEIDAGGFVFFANYLVYCHAAYEGSLRESGIELRQLFVANSVLIPISKTQVQYVGPLASGNKVRVDLTRARLSEAAYRVDYRITHVGTPDKLVGLAYTEHVALDLHTLAHKPLPAELGRWLAGGA
jgi:YbgC/YbaW family acyl-CoA thioester hydrolase